MKKILIVDDDPDILVLSKKKLEANGYSVITAADGIQGYKKATEEKPDLIILDITMPHKDGITLLRELRSCNLTWNMPIIMLSGRGSSSTLFECEKYKTTDYFIKPCDWDELLKTIQKYL